MSQVLLVRQEYFRKACSNRSQSEKHGKQWGQRVSTGPTVISNHGTCSHIFVRRTMWLKLIWPDHRRKRKVEKQVVATSVDTEGEQITIEERTTEVTAPGGKKTRTKKVTVERGEYVGLGRAPKHVLCTLLRDPSGEISELVLFCAVLYTTELRAPKLEGPAVRLLTWNVASLRSSLKKVSLTHRGPLQQHCRLHTPSQAPLLHSC